MRTYGLKIAITWGAKVCVWGGLRNHSKSRNPSTWNVVLSLPVLQELQRTYKSAGGSEIQLSSLWGRLLKSRPRKTLLATNPWNRSQGDEDRNQEAGHVDWRHPWGRNVTIISGQAGYILQQIKQDWYPDFPIKAKHIFKDFLKIKHLCY